METIIALGSDETHEVAHAPVEGIQVSDQVQCRAFVLDGVGSFGQGALVLVDFHCQDVAASDTAVGGGQVIGRGRLSAPAFQLHDSDGAVAFQRALDALAHVALCDLALVGVELLHPALALLS